MPISCIGAIGRRPAVGRDTSLISRENAKETVGFGGTMAREPIGLATEPDFKVGPIQVRPSFREMVRNDGRRETVEPRIMQVLVALASTDGIVGRG